jgi:hypothetical protein
MRTACANATPTGSGPPDKPHTTTDQSVAAFRLLWLEIAEQQYLDLPVGTHQAVDDILTRLSDDPRGISDAGYHAPSDQWTTVIPDVGILVYAVVHDDATVIILRIIHIPGR